MNLKTHHLPQPRNSREQRLATLPQKLQISTSIPLTWHIESDKRLPCSLDFALGPYLDIKVFSHFSREDAGPGMENMTAPARLKPQDVASLPHRVLERFRELRQVTLLEDE